MFTFCVMINHDMIKNYLGWCEMIKRDVRKRSVRRVKDAVSDRVFSFRVTQKEYELIHTARDRGHDPRAILLDQLRSKMGVQKRDQTKT